MKEFFTKVWEFIKDQFKKSLKYLYVAIPLAIIAYLGFKFVKDPDSFLQKKDVEKAKEKIKTARDTVVVSKDVRKKAAAEVMKIQAKSKVRYSDYEKSTYKVEDLEEITHELEADLIKRKTKTSSFLKKR